MAPIGHRPLPVVLVVHNSRANARYSKYSRRSRATDGSKQSPQRGRSRPCSCEWTSKASRISADRGNEPALPTPPGALGRSALTTSNVAMNTLRTCSARFPAKEATAGDHLGPSQGGYLGAARSHPRPAMVAFSRTGSVVVHDRIGRITLENRDGTGSCAVGALFLMFPKEAKGRPNALPFIPI